MPKVFKSRDCKLWSELIVVNKTVTLLSSGLHMILLKTLADAQVDSASSTNNTCRHPFDSSVRAMNAVTSSISVFGIIILDHCNTTLG